MSYRRYFPPLLHDLERAAGREWILANGLGGYAMGTLAGVATRRYHGHLVAAVNPPTDRVLLLAAVECELKVGQQSVGLSTNLYPGTVHPRGYLKVTEVGVGPSVYWKYSALGTDLEKELVLVPGENTAAVRYVNHGPLAVELTLRPLVADRDHHGEFAFSHHWPAAMEINGGHARIDGTSTLHLTYPGAVATPVQGWYYRFEHPRESERGLAARDDLYCPLELRVRLAAGEQFVLTASTLAEPSAPTWPLREGLAAPGPTEPSVRETLIAATDRLCVRTGNRQTILAGYPWFTDWGRDTMISLPGMCLVPGRLDMARAILRDYARLLSNGLIPNRVVSEGQIPDYNAVDATLWYAVAIYRTLRAEWDEAFARDMLPVLHQIYFHHVKGTDFGIRVDPRDGLLMQGEPGVQLTWMDAKIGDWVVTPRYGKPVEIAALWISALRCMQWIALALGEDAAQLYTEAAIRAEASFERTFWHAGRGHYLDTADPADATLRPNQVLAMAVPFTPCAADHGRRALEVVRDQLWTPMGLRTLGPNEPGFQARFEGPMEQRDAAYHRGTAWPWLLGPFATAWVRFTGDVDGARDFLRPAIDSLDTYGIDGIAEVADATEPQRPGGCPWQAWSVAEILRAWAEDCRGD
ncbi:MAG: amylo-alpha-1,6-glucosidase [Fimbriimonadaceae bacterium]|nr:amylo-alpha-1,6-glucosidase [Fimbriimonadaceae bacterium]